VSTPIGSGEERVLGPVVIAFWPWNAEASALATLRGAISGAPDAAAVLLPDNALAAELVTRLAPPERGRVSRVGGPDDDGLRSFLHRIAAACPGADLAVVADAGEMPAGWLARLLAAAHTDDTVAVGTARATGGTAPTLAALEATDRDTEAVAPGERGGHTGHTGLPLPGSLVPRVLLPEPNGCLIRRSAFELLGGLDPELSHPQALLADFAARGRELGLSCALAPDTIIRRSAGGLDPCPSAELQTLERRHPWLRAARTDERALDPGPLKRSLVASRAAREGISVTVDARSLGSGFGGTQSYVGSLLLALARSGAVSVRAVLGAEPEPELHEELMASGVEIVDYEDAARGELPRTDVIHRPQQVFTPSDLRLLQLVGERLVVTHMDLIAYRAPTYHDSVDAWRAYRRTSRLALATADRVIFLSEHARRDALAEELVPEDRAVVAGIGIAPAPALADGDRPGRIPADTDLLLVLGADYAHKNRPFAIKLLGELVRRHGWPGMLVLAGAHVPHGSSVDAEAELLRARPDLAARVIDLGPVSDAEKRWLLGSAVAHVAPSTYEGFGLAPLEAAAVGRPCLYAPRSSLAEIIDPAGATIVPWDPAATADAAVELLRPGPARERHLRLLAEALQQHTWERVIPRILAAYEGAVASPSRASAPRAWAELKREELAADLLARVADGMALIDARGALLTPAQQRGLMRVAVRPWLKRPLLGGFGLLGIDHREPRGAGRADGEPSDSAP
jgi:glycosyltransferase involved in cell wall biosynthesis